MATFRYVLVDVFTDTPLAGNGLAVFTDAREIPEEMLQPLARELNLSETVFTYTPEGDGHARIRIFTPNAELRFAGHPTLGSAFVLGGPLQLHEVRIETKKGVIPVRLEREGPRIVFGRMEQPLPTFGAYGEADDLLAVLGVESSELPVEIYDNGMEHVYVTLGSEDEVAGLKPDLTALSEFPPTRGFNCIAGSGSRWKTRMFAPAGGVPEDPATGSCAAALAGYLAAREAAPNGSFRWVMEQGFEMGRPSILELEADKRDGAVVAVRVAGDCVVVSEGWMETGR